MSNLDAHHEQERVAARGARHPEGACEVFFPGGKVTVGALRTKIRKGRVGHTAVAGKLIVTARWSECEWLRRSSSGRRVKPSLMQSRVDPCEASGYLGMSVETLLDVCGHHHSDFQQSAARAMPK